MKTFWIGLLLILSEVLCAFESVGISCQINEIWLKLPGAKSCWIDAFEILTENVTVLTKDLEVEGFYLYANKKIKFIPKNLSVSLPNLKALEVSHCSVEVVRKESFAQLFRLGSLYLNNNEIKQVESGAFDDLKNLIILTLSHNVIESLDAFTFRSQIQLAVLKLSNNSLTNVSEELFEPLKSLERLNLDGNKIKALGRNVFKHLKALKEINLSLNYLSMLNDNIFETNKNLETIHLQMNKLELINSTLFDNKKKLLKVNFRDNVCIDSLFTPSSIDDMKKALKDNCASRLEDLSVEELIARLNESEEKNKMFRKQHANVAESCDVARTGSSVYCLSRRLFTLFFFDFKN